MKRALTVGRAAPASTVKISVPELTNASGPTDLNLAVRHVIVGRLHADEVAAPSRSGPCGRCSKSGARRRTSPRRRHIARMIASTSPVVKLASACSAILVASASVTGGMAGRRLPCSPQGRAGQERCNRRTASPPFDERQAIGSGRLLQMLAAEQLGDLHRVQRRALAQIVADDPQATGRSRPSDPRGSRLTKVAYSPTHSTGVT